MRGEIGLLPGNRWAHHGRAVEEESRRHSHMWKNDNIDLVQRCRLTEVLIREIGVGNPESIEHVSDPALVLRLAPGVNQSDPRQVDGMARDFGRVPNLSDR